MSDPLSLLRECTVSGRPVEARADRLIFGGSLAYRKDVSTNFRMASGGYYSLHAAWYLLQKTNLPHSRYLVEAHQEKVPAVLFLDRKDLLSFLRGESASSTKIDSSAFTAPPEPVVEPDVGSSTATFPSIYDGRSQNENLLEQASDRDTERQQRFVGDADGNADAANLSTTQQMSSATGYHIPVSEDDMTQILVYERLLRTRNSVLRSSTKDFQSILQLLADIRRKEAAQKASTSLSQPVAGDKKRTTYNRYASRPEEEILRERIGATAIGLDIDTTASFLPTQPPSAPPERVRTAAAVPSSSAKVTALSLPIIIVPPLPTAMISMWNVVDFLEHHRFVTAEQKQREPGAKRTNAVVIEHTTSNKRKMAYRVIDTPHILLKHEWNDVVAVFVFGQPWQFRGWPFSFPAELFDAVRGIYVQYDDSAVDPTVANWNVAIVKVSRTKRHLDSLTARKLWEELERFVASKPRLRHFLAPHE